LRLAPNRWAVAGAVLVLALAAAALLVPSLLAAAGNRSAPAAFGADSPLVSWDRSITPTGPAGVEALASDAGDVDLAGSRLVAHVAGAVAQPGVYEFEDGARVVDAVEAAGGATAEADLAVLNLAARLVDGQRIYVPKPGETPPAALQPDGGAGSGGSDGRSGGAVASGGGKINVNQAGAEALTDLPGIGPVLAQRIVDFRSVNGPFEKLNDLAEVSGIGPKVLAGLADAVVFQ
jgi:competence protein ComEA